jgi:hypothetical protein
MAGKVFGTKKEEEACRSERCIMWSLGVILYAVFRTENPKECEMVWECNSRGNYEKCIRNFGGGNPKGEHWSGDVEVD